MRYQTITLQTFYYGGTFGSLGGCDGILGTLELSVSFGTCGTLLTCVVFAVAIVVGDINSLSFAIGFSVT